jgi:hypothetical protein
MVIVSLDSPSCEVTLFDPVYRDVTRQAKGLYRLKHVGALGSGLAYLSRYNSGWFCHNLFTCCLVIYSKYYFVVSTIVGLRWNRYIWVTLL